MPPEDPSFLMFQKRLPCDSGQLHILCPAGLGDNAWIWSKLHSIAKSRDVTFWLPGEEQRRSGALFQLYGVRYGYLPRLSTRWVWDRRGDPPIPDTGGIISVHTNAALENGIRIERWYPELPFINPSPQENVAIYKNVVGDPKYVVAFMCHAGYMEGNLMPGQWARIFRQIEKDVAPVLIVGADQDVAFVNSVCEIFDPMMSPLLNAPLDQVLSTIRDAKAFVGVASGLSILSTYLNVPTFHAYPRHLRQMPGTWETEDSKWGWSFVDDLPFEMDKVLHVCNL